VNLKRVATRILYDTSNQNIFNQWSKDFESASWRKKPQLRKNHKSLQNPS